MNTRDWPVVAFHDLVVGCVSASYQYGSFVMDGRDAGAIIGLRPGCGSGLIGGYTDGWCGGIGNTLSGLSCQLGRIGTYDVIGGIRGHDACFVIFMPNTNGSSPLQTFAY